MAADDVEDVVPELLELRRTESRNARQGLDGLRRFAIDGQDRLVLEDHVGLPLEALRRAPPVAFELAGDRSAAIAAVPDELVLAASLIGTEDMVRAFREGTRPEITFDDGVEVVRLLMAAYKSAEEGRAIDPSSPELVDFEPAVSRGEWRPA